MTKTGGAKFDEPTVMKAHLANICKSCPEDISKYWRDKLAEQTINYTRTSKQSNLPHHQATITQHFSSNQPLPLQVNSRLDKSLIKMWIITGVPFEIIENPFTIDFLKELNPGYAPPSRTTLSGRFLDEEVTRVNKYIDQELENAENLTLVLDGWTSIRSDSLYNFIIITSERKEYLIALKNFSKESHTGEMLANEIAIIIEKIGSEKFAAVVTDAAANCRVAREKIQFSYPHIWNIRGIAHAFNLIASDLVKLDAIKEFITKCNKLCRFFHDSNKSNAYLKQGLAEMKIKSEGLKTWIKTRWGSLYSTTNSILKAQPVFDWIIRILKDEEFFSTCRFIRHIWEPIKESINRVESKSVDLADCFIFLIKLAVAIHQISNLNPFKREAIIIFNKRYEEFLHPIYTLTYFLHPHYRGRGLKDSVFREIALTAVQLWQNLGHSDNSCKELLSQLRRYEAKLNPFDLTYTEIDTPQVWWGSIKKKPQHLVQLAIRLFSITPSQASCERDFSTLKWLLGDHRTRMNITILEGMTKVRSYYLSNICNELKYYGKELTENDIRSVINNTNMGDILELDDEESEIDINNNILNDNNNNSLIIGNIIDLNNFENENEISDEINDNEIGTLDYNPEDIINNFLFDELNETNNEMELNNRSDEMELNERNDEMESN
ncbi:hypothetical protein Glove_26g327 [Diversispora epigaea]|uniref:DUF659 domain-containing protein n=1 Tax=Diversispora epigaea TaxID=1348612 RepID=A0A397JJL9_9GLOM|nr:hypothetical protein Glove_26g327 [Diversispora epigaea]